MTEQEATRIVTAAGGSIEDGYIFISSEQLKQKGVKNACRELILNYGHDFECSCNDEAELRNFHIVSAFAAILSGVFIVAVVVGFIVILVKII